MSTLRRRIGWLPLIALATACGAAEPESRAAADGRSLPVWALTTDSEEARQLVLEGYREADLAGLTNNMPVSPKATELFKRAIALDPNFALAYLEAARNAPSLLEYRANLERAVALADGASEVERLLIGMAQSTFAGDVEGALKKAEALVALEPENPRAHMELAAVQSRLGREEDARATASRSMELDPSFIHAHLWLANSYAQSQPSDLVRAEEHARQAVTLAPEAAQPHDMLGDALRAQGRLQEAAAEYTLASELDPTNAGVLQQRGHVHSFLGDYERARADYDAAVALGAPPVKATYAFYRPLVHLHAGNPGPAVEELDSLYRAIDSMGVSDPEADKLFALQVLAFVAAHAGFSAKAEAAAERFAELARAQAHEVGTDDFKRQAEALVAYVEGFVAVHGGDVAGARERAAETMRLRAPDRDPTKDWNAHQLLGLAALKEGKHDEALRHLEQTGRNDMYALYHRGRALEGAGRAAEARAVFERFGSFYFNDPAVALLRSEAIARAKTL